MPDTELPMEIDEPQGDQPVETPSPAPVGEEPKQEEDRATQLAEENKALREQLNETIRMFGAREPAPPATPPVVEPRKEEPPEMIDFVSGAGLDSLFDDPGPVLNKVLNKVFHMGREQALRDIPQMVQAHAAQTVDIRMKAKEFWDKNSDLEPFGDFVSMLANKVSVDNPNWGLDEVYAETAKTARERLKLLQQEPAADGTPSNSPDLPAPRGARRPLSNEPVLAREEKEMDDLWKAFGG